MERTGPLDDFLQENDFDAFLMREDSQDANMYYLTEFGRSDPFTFLRKDGETTIIVSQLEYSRAKEEARADNILSTAEFDTGDAENRTEEFFRQVVERFELEKVAVPEDFPLKLAETLRGQVELKSVEDRIMEARKTKSEEEIGKLKEAQEATEDAIKHVEKMIEEAETRNGELYLDKEPLTSERVRREIRKFLLEKDCKVPHQTIVACGEDSSKPHSAGSGVLESEKPIVVDIFPRHENRYFGDMTRTFVKGEASEKIRERKGAVLEAQKAAFKVLENGAGVEASEVHDAVCDVLEEKGYNTLRQDRNAESGFIHSTGHAVGLELHETPGISENNEELEAGNVLTIEPGLYLPEGGVRIEDMILVKKNGYENFNSMHKNLEIK